MQIKATWQKPTIIKLIIANTFSSKPNNFTDGTGFSS